MGWLGRVGSALSFTVVCLIVAASPAGALTLGTATAPSGTTPASCSGTTQPAEVIQATTDASVNYTVPAGGGEIVSWSFDTVGATAGSPYGLAVMRPVGGGYQVVGSDVESVPASAPAVATFNLTTPIAVEAGDVLGVVVEPTFSADCQFTGADAGDTAYIAEGALTAGTTVTQLATAPSILANISADLVQSADVAITQRVLPASITAGGDAVFLLAVTSTVPFSPVTVTDAIPAGLTVVSAAAGTDPCAAAGQTVSCQLPGAPSEVAIVVSGAKAGTYANTSLATGSLSDPNEANNSASGTLKVTAPFVHNPAPRCHVVSMTDVPLAEAKSVVRALGCAVGKVTTKQSRSVPTGDVISTSPRGGRTAPLGTKIAIVVSGKPKK